jgi:membrane protease YdiL (CAAX protease family)
MSEQECSLKRVWILLIISPLILFDLSSIFAMYFGFRFHGESEAIGTSIINTMPYILMINHTILFVILLSFLKKDGLTLQAIGWNVNASNKTKDIIGKSIIGIIAGILIVIFDCYLLGPVIQTLGIKGGGFQPGIQYIIGATFFAGIVEESIYRGYAITLFEKKFNKGLAVLISSIFFIPLHFGTGIQNMICVFVFGLIFAGLFLWRRSLITNAFAHAVANLIPIILFMG